MFEIIKWFMLFALLIAMAKASETLEVLETLGLLARDALHDNILVLSALFNFFLLIITGLVFVLTLSSGFPVVFSKNPRNQRVSRLKSGEELVNSVGK